MHLPVEPLEERVARAGGIQALCKHDTREGRLWRKALKSRMLTVWDADELCVKWFGSGVAAQLWPNFYDVDTGED